MTIELWDDVMALERRVDDLLRSFLGPRARLSFPALPVGVRRPFVPATDVYQRKGDLIVRVELPGVDPTKDVTVAVEDGTLVVRGERRQLEEVEEEEYYRMEATYGAFERRIPLPEGVEESRIAAEYRDGMLEVVVPGAAPVAKAPRARTIQIKVPKTSKAA